MAKLVETFSCDHFPHRDQYDKDSHSWTDHLLEKVSIRSLTRGRVRYSIGIEGDEVLNDILRKEVAKILGARLASYNYQTKTALVYFDEQRCNAVTVTKAILGAVQEFGKKHGDCEIGDEHQHLPPHRHRTPQHDGEESCDGDGHHDHDHDHEHRHHEPHDHGTTASSCGHDDCGHEHAELRTQKDVRREVVKLVATGAVLGFFVYRRLILGATPALRGPLGTVSALATIMAGYPIFRGGLNTMQKGKRPTDDTLISIAVAATLVLRENITGLSVVWLINIGRFLEAVTLRNSRNQIKGLLDLTPDETWLVNPESRKIRKVSTELIERGAIIRSYRSERIALDGVIVRGNASVIESHLNGEPLPRFKQVGDRVFAGSIIDSGEVDIEVQSEAHETAVAKIVYEVERMQQNKAPIERYGAKFASTFVPVSLGIGAGVLVFTGDWRRAIASLVIACPCAAGLATPTAVSASIGRAARRGILIKGGTHLEAAANVDQVIFDKTGTLTRGYPELVGIDIIAEDWDEPRILQYTASLEQHATHPLARTLVKEAEKRGLELDPITDYQVHPGRGITANLGGKLAIVGNYKFIQEQGVAWPRQAKSEAEDTLVYFVYDNQPVANLSFSDAIRDNTMAALSQLRALGIERISLVSGDRLSTTNAIGKKLGITAVVGEAMPQDKSDYIRRYQAQGHTIAMVGDGVNDAQALAAADLSIAMAAGRCDLAIETADITISQDNVELVPEVISIARQTLRTIKVNFVASIGVNAVGLALGASGRLSPLAAALVHNLSTLAVVGNSMALGMRLGRAKPVNHIDPRSNE